MEIAVYGATGHTARFVIAELLRRGHTPVAIGRDEFRLTTGAASYGVEVETRIADLHSAESLDRALRGTNAVIHCAGPFLDTAQPMIEAALRARINYFDITAEQASALSTFENFDAPARERGIFVVPAVGFYGGLGDLLATDAMSGWAQADEIELAIALDSWWPTPGTRQTGQRNTVPRLALSGGKLKPIQPSAPASRTFPKPFGTQDTIELPFTETILIARHSRVCEIRNYINQTPLRDLRNPATPGPVAADEHGRSNQRFLVDVTVRNGNEERHIWAQGRDIYATTAPIVVEAVERICEGSHQEAGAFAIGELVDASAFIQKLVRLGEIVIATDQRRRSRRDEHVRQASS